MQTAFACPLSYDSFVRRTRNRVRNPARTILPALFTPDGRPESSTFRRPKRCPPCSDLAWVGSRLLRPGSSGSALQWLTPPTGERAEGKVREVGAAERQAACHRLSRRQWAAPECRRQAPPPSYVNGKSMQEAPRRAERRASGARGSRGRPGMGVRAWFGVKTALLPGGSRTPWAWRLGVRVAGVPCVPGRSPRRF